MSSNFPFTERRHLDCLPLVVGLPGWNFSALYYVGPVVILSLPLARQRILVMLYRSVLAFAERSSVPRSESAGTVLYVPVLSNSFNDLLRALA